MKYVRNYDDFKRFSFEFFDTFLPSPLSDQMVNYFILGLGDEKHLIGQALQYIKNHPLGQNDVAEYGEAILQLSEYRDLLKKFVNLLLLSNSYEQLCAFLDRIFLSQIGEKKYHSHKFDYSIEQRYFDRFVEIIDYCQIDKQLYYPFFVAILNSEPNSRMFVYKQPLKEYMDVFLTQDNDEEFVSNLLLSQNKTDVDKYTDSTSEKLTKSLINDYAFGNINATNIIKKILLKNKQVGFNEIEELLSSQDEQVKFRSVQMLLLIKEDRRVMDRLKYLYNLSADGKIKTLLEKECGFNSLQNFTSKDQFLQFVDNNVKEVQVRLFGARLKRYYEKYNLNNSGIEGKIMTYIMEFFKARETDNQLSQLSTYFKFVDTRLLSDLTRVVYEVALYREKLQKSKWTLRLIAVFGDKNLLQDMLLHLKEWIKTKSQEPYAKYFLEMLSLAGREEVVELSKQLLKLNLTNKQNKFFEELLNKFCSYSKQSIEDVKDTMVDDLGFNNKGYQDLVLDNKTIRVSINVDCSLSYFNLSTNKVARLRDDETYNGQEIKKFLKQLEKGIKEQKKKLYQFFIDFRQYDLDSFEKCILSNNLICYLSQFILWGRYKGDKLVEVCYLENGGLKHLAGNLILENLQDYIIAMLQPMDAMEYKGIIENAFQTLFDQFNLPVFLPSEISSNMTYVNIASGTFCNAQLFVTRLQKLKYKINDLDEKNNFGTLVRENKNLNLLTCVIFDKVNLYNMNTSTTLSKVEFYDLSKTIKNGKNYNLDKNEALVLSTINKRVLSNQIAQILVASRN